MEKNEYIEKLAIAYHNACKDAVATGQTLLKAGQTFIEWVDLPEPVKMGRIGTMISFLKAVVDLSKIIADALPEKQYAWATETVDQEGLCLACKKPSKHIITNFDGSIQHYYCDEHLKTVMDFVVQFYPDGKKHD